jgi:lipoprotein-releasing system permease protein
LDVASFIARRIAFNRQQSFSRFIIRLAIAATAISVAAMLLTFAFTNGFQYEISRKMFSFSGHLRILRVEPERSANAEESPVEKNDSVVQMVSGTDGVKTIQAFATRSAIIKGPESIEGVLMKGVERNYDFSNLAGFLQSGHWIQFPDSGYSTEINISTYTAKQLKLKAQDRVVVYFIQPDGSRRVRPMRVAGIFKTGVEDFDKIFAISDLKLIQRLNDWKPDQIAGYEVFLRDYRQLDSANAAIFTNLPVGWTSHSIREIYANIFDWLNLQNTTIAIVILIMVVVAILNLITCLIILLLERTRMIGILKALGCRDRSIQKIFLYHGAIITVIGIVAGNLLGLLVCWLQQKYGFITLPEDAYFISKAAVRLEWWHVLVVNAGTFIVCFLVLMIPTVIAKRIQPAKAITFR